MIDFNNPDSLSVSDILSENGLIAKTYDGYEERPQQVEMALAVQKAFNEGSHLAVEAGTGVGKSFAYLVSAIDQVLRKRGKVIISTYTISLQEQLINKDIPFLADVIGGDFTACLAKGRTNYLCKRRLDYAIARQKGQFQELIDDIMLVAAWASDTKDGSLSDMPEVPSPGVWDAVKSEHGNCRGRKCPHFRDCFYWKARRKLDTANIIVANHALLFSDLVLKEVSPGILPEYNFVVIDEAHNVEHVAEDHFGINITNYTISYLLSHLYNTRTRRGLLAFITGADNVIALVEKCTEAAKVFFTQVQAWHEHAKDETSGKCHPNFVDDNITETLKELRVALGELSKKGEDEDDRFEFERYIDRCKGLEESIKEFLTQPQEGSIYWVEVSKGRRRRISLRSAPLNVGPDIKRCLFDKFDSVIMTSATLSCDGSDDAGGFEFFAGRIGLEDFRALQLGSPFDYKRQVTMYVEADLPEPNNKDFHAEAMEKVKKYLLQTDGKAFVLFTSYVMLRKFADGLTDFLAENQMELLTQGGGTDRSTLLEHFKDDHRSVLFGTDSFWQGVDVPGQALSNVIIVRLPFAVPNHPLIQGRIEQIRQKGESPFFTYQLPMAIIRFKQGFGRLVRNKTDTGIVVVLDSRIVRKNYGKRFLSAMPDCTVEVITKNS
ncbi:MAG TPA: helicase [Phycisphaerales bacterium]|nr:helicase [Phycisphaerales bacterium]